MRRGLLCQTLPLLGSQSSVAHGCGGLGVLSCKNCENTAMLRRSSANTGNNRMKSGLGCAQLNPTLRSSGSLRQLPEACWQLMIAAKGYTLTNVTEKRRTNLEKLEKFNHRGNSHHEIVNYIIQLLAEEHVRTQCLFVAFGAARHGNGGLWDP